MQPGLMRRIGVSLSFPVLGNANMEFYFIRLVDRFLLCEKRGFVGSATTD